MTPRVTIAIPSFNAARWIAAAVQSALDQTWSEKEVIVVDDGSTDDSLAILERFGDSIRVICAEHRGGNHARNLALQHATGEWLQFLDADDYLEPPKIARQFAETENGAGADVIYSPVWWETWSGDQATERSASQLDPSRDLYTQWLTWELPQTGGCLWRKSALEKLSGWKLDQPCCQEHELYARALQAEMHFVFAPTPHAVYRVWSEETLCRKNPRQVIEVKTSLIESLREWMQSRGLWTEAHQRAAGTACFELARTFAKEDLTEAARYHAAQRALGLIHLAGPAAPAPYRVMYQLLGFANAERVARWLR
jgi:hypothetical protein